MEHITIEECCDILDSRRIPITASERRNGRYPYYGANGIQDYVADYIFDDELVLLAEDGGNFGSKTRPIAYRVSGKCWVNNHAHVLKPMANVDVDYLCYSLMFYDTEELVNGATRQKLTQAAMRKMLIPFNPYWHIYDQVIIRPSLRSRFVDGNLKIITGSANVSLLDKNKHPNHSISDHLPITFEIKEDYHEQNT